MRREAVFLALLAGCSGPKSEDCKQPSWSPVFEHDLDRAVLSAFGSRIDDLSIVGGGLGVPDRRALFAHYDGHAWTEMVTPHSETLWWGWAAPGPGTNLWAVGDQGLVLRFDGTGLSEIATSTRATLYGVIGSASDDVWIVGGIPGAGASSGNDLVLHWDGQHLLRDRTVPTSSAALFKVWGTGSNDLWVSGERGTLWHRGAEGWRDRSKELHTKASLFTVHGCASDEVYAVGGKTVFAYDGAAWSALPVEVPTQAVGVSCSAAGVLVVGTGGLKMRRPRGQSDWIDEQVADPFRTDFHGAWIGADGSALAVGGNYLEIGAGVSTRSGVVGYFGCARPGSEIKQSP